MAAVKSVSSGFVASCAILLVVLETVVGQIAILGVLHGGFERDRLVFFKLVLLGLRLVEARQLLVLLGQLAYLVQTV